MYLKSFIFYLLSKLTILNIFFINKFYNNKLILLERMAFGETFSYCIENYLEIKRSGKKIITKNDTEDKIVNFFFPNKNLKLLFSVPNFISYYWLNDYLLKNEYFNQNVTKLKEAHNLKELEKVDRKKKKNLIISLLKKNEHNVTKSIKKLKKKKYILMHIKHYSNDINNTEGSSPRSTSNLNKILKTIKFLKRKNIKIVILGDKFDLFIKKYKRTILNDVVFFEDLSKNQSVIDQIYIHYYSTLCIGNPGGAFIISMYLQKKIIFLDSLIHVIDKFPMMYDKNVKNLYKKIIIKNQKNILSDVHIKNLKKRKINYQIIETSLDVIKKSLSKYI
jgi:hypothetical protein